MNRDAFWPVATYLRGSQPAENSSLSGVCFIFPTLCFPSLNSLCPLFHLLALPRCEHSVTANPTHPESPGNPEPTSSVPTRATLLAILSPGDRKPQDDSLVTRCLRHSQSHLQKKSSSVSSPPLLSSLAPAGSSLTPAELPRHSLLGETRQLSGTCTKPLILRATDKVETRHSSAG